MIYNIEDCVEHLENKTRQLFLFSHTCVLKLSLSFWTMLLCDLYKNIHLLVV